MLTIIPSFAIVGVSATDPLTFGVIALLLTFVALLARWSPARWVMRVEPQVDDVPWDVGEFPSPNAEPQRAMARSRRFTKNSDA